MGRFITSNMTLFGRDEYDEFSFAKWEELGLYLMDKFEAGDDKDARLADWNRAPGGFLMPAEGPENITLSYMGFDYEKDIHTVLIDFEDWDGTGDSPGFRNDVRFDDPGIGGSPTPRIR